MLLLKQLKRNDKDAVTAYRLHVGFLQQYR